MFRMLAALFCLLLAPLAFANPIDVNSASVGELDSLPGIGPSKAQAIVTYRTENGPFTNVEDLDHVPGIGPATLEGLRDQVTVGGGAAPAAGSAAPSTASSQSAAPAAPSGSAVNINTATVSEIEQLPGVGATKAAAIVADRTANGPFATCRDLIRVTGIGPATVGNLGSRCSVE